MERHERSEVDHVAREKEPFEHIAVTTRKLSESYLYLGCLLVAYIPPAMQMPNEARSDDIEFATTATVGEVGDQTRNLKHIIVTARTCLPLTVLPPTGRS